MREHFRKESLSGRLKFQCEHCLNLNPTHNAPGWYGNHSQASQMFLQVYKSLFQKYQSLLKFISQTSTHIGYSLHCMMCTNGSTQIKTHCMTLSAPDNFFCTWYSIRQLLNFQVKLQFCLQDLWCIFYCHHAAVTASPGVSCSTYKLHLPWF